MRATPLIAAALIASSGALASTAAIAETPPRQLTVSGEGSVTAAPDLAFITAGVVTEAETAEEAIAQNAMAMAAVIDKLKASGIAETDIQTSRFSLTPKYESKSGALNRREDQPRIFGYTASNQVRVTVREVAKVGGVLDEVVGSGANTLSGVSFAISEPEPLLDQARANAVAAAVAKANLYAEAASVSLGNILRIDEGGGYAPRPAALYARAEAMAADTPIAPGEQEVTANVTIVYEIK
ncbi:MAG: SIMPL domain-containing protein [Pseudomonadota bacterium]